MRGVDLTLFDFDYDLTWYAFTLTPKGEVLHRFGGREPEKSGTYHSLDAFHSLLQRSLEDYERIPTPGFAKPSRAPIGPKKAEDFPGARRFGERGCIHCHHIHEMRWEERRASGEWKLELMWIYPPVRNLGFVLEPGHGFRLSSVLPHSVAEKAGLNGGDVLEAINGISIASAADVQWAIHLLPERGNVEVAWRRKGKTEKGRLQLPNGWRVSDLSWRWSIRSLKPNPGVFGEDLSPDEKRKLGLAENGLAFRQGPFASLAVRQAGILTGDVIWGLNGKPFNMSARQFDTHLRLHHRVGETIRYEILRGSEKSSIPYKLSE